MMRVPLMLRTTRSKEDQTVVKTSPGDPDLFVISTRDIKDKIRDNARIEYLKKKKHVTIKAATVSSCKYQNSFMLDEKRVY